MTHILLVSSASPYARMATVMVYEKGLCNRVRRQVVDAMSDAPELIKANPLGLIPTLILEDGRSVSETFPVISVLDAMASPALIPSGLDDRVVFERRRSLAMGLLDCAVRLVQEGRRAQPERSVYWQDRWVTKIRRTLAVIADSVPESVDGRQASFDLLCVAVALDYLSFRHPLIDWRVDHPALSDFRAQLMDHPSLSRTMPA